MIALTCLIVEDEPLAAGILEDYIRQTPVLRLAGVCPDAVYAAEAMQQTAVDVLFLDIHLPGMKGLDFLGTLRPQPQVVLTTAYHEYALRGYDYGVVDYLLKPIDFARFQKAVQKLHFPANAIAGRPYHFFNVGKKMVRVWLDEVVALESLKEYVRLYLSDGSTLVTKGALAEFELMLSAQRLLRVHRSYAVALPHVTAYTASSVYLGEQCIPIGRQFKNKVQDAIRKE